MRIGRKRMRIGGIEDEDRKEEAVEG